MSKSTIVIAAWLKKHGACSDQVATFRKEWGESVRLTRAVLLRAAELELDLNWWAERTLTLKQRAEYDKVKAPALAEYDKVTAAASVEYNKVKAAALAEYDKVTVPASVEYDKVTAAALADILGLEPTDE